MLNFFRKILVFVLAISLSPILILADGFIVHPVNYPVYETNQKAVIFYESGRETMVVSTAFRGVAKDFAWIIPVPNRPKVEKSSDEIFASLDDLTKIEKDWERPMSLMNGEQVIKRGKSPVIVWETRKVGYYDLVVLSADNSHNLVTWLNKNGYRYPKESDYILNDYIKNHWFFVAAKIDLNLVQDQNINRQIKTGHLIPLKISFAASKIVYPLKISSIQTKLKYRQLNQSEKYIYHPADAGILIYVFTQHKQILPKFKTLYANWVKADQIKNLAYDNQGNPWIKTSKTKYFLTKLYRRMDFSEMTYDLYPRPADNDQVVPYVPSINHSPWKFYRLLIISGLLILVFLGWMIYEFRKISK